MNKLKNVILSLAPLAAPLVVEMANVVIKDKYFIPNENADDYNESIIVIDFSQLTHISTTTNQTFDLEIRKRYDNLNHLIIEWRYTDEGEWKSYFQEEELWNHKGFWLGNMVNDFVENNQTIIFKNLTIGPRQGYDLSQPDFMFAQLFMYVFKIPFSTLIMNYADPDWFVSGTAIGGMFYSIDKIDWYNEKVKTKSGRYELCRDYFLRNKKYTDYILNTLIDMVSETNIFDGYDLNMVWNTEWIKGLNIEILDFNK